MEKMLALQARAIELTEKKLAAIEFVLTELKDTKNVFDIESRTYYLGQLMKLLGKNVESIYTEMYRVNSLPHAVNGGSQ